MFKLDRKLIISATVALSVSLLAIGCNAAEPAATQAKTTTPALSIDGGVSYPVENGKTAAYYISGYATGQAGYKLNNGRIPNTNELNRWNTDIMPDGTGLPEGSGTVSDGEEVYEAKCVMCHGDFGSGGGGYPALSKGNAYEMHKTLTNNRWKDPEAAGPVRVFGSYWPQASTLWWYIRDGMPHPKSDTLSDDETYALVAYILNINEMKIDGEAVDEDYELDREKFLKIKMPNVDGFEPNIAGPKALERVRAYYANPTNFGAQKVNPSERCMKDCQKSTVKVNYIKNGGISDFVPPMATARDLPALEVKSIDPKAVYENTCAACHDSYLSPGSNLWEGYTAKGMDKVYANGLSGTEGGMPAKGGSTLSDSDFKLVVDYLISGK
jgi:cytochrome c